MKHHGLQIQNTNREKKNVDYYSHLSRCNIVMLYASVACTDCWCRLYNIPHTATHSAMCLILKSWFRLMKYYTNYWLFVNCVSFIYMNIITAERKKKNNNNETETETEKKCEGDKGMNSRKPNKHYKVNSQFTYIASHAKISRLTLTHIFLLKTQNKQQRQNEIKLNVPIYLTNNVWLKSSDLRICPISTLHISINWMQCVCVCVCVHQVRIQTDLKIHWHHFQQTVGVRKWFRARNDEDLICNMQYEKHERKNDYVQGIDLVNEK